MSPEDTPGGVWEPFLISNPKKNGEILLFYAREMKRPGPGDTQIIAMKRSTDGGVTYKAVEKAKRKNGPYAGIMITPKESTEITTGFVSIDDTGVYWFKDLVTLKAFFADDGEKSSDATLLDLYPGGKQTPKLRDAIAEL